MANPVLHRADAFAPRAQVGYQQQYAGQQYPGQGYPGMQYPGMQYPGQAQQVPGALEDRMTIDDVVAKTSLTMLVLALVAAGTFVALPAALTGMALIVTSLVGFVTVMLVSARRRINPGLVLLYAGIEGVFIGAFSRIFANAYDGIIPQAIVATFVTAGVTLAAYRFGNFRVSPKMRRVVSIATLSFAGVMLVNFLLSLAGINLGLRFGALGLVAALLGIGLAVMNLLTDFDDIDRGVRMGAPASESWRAAFGLTVTMVWLYTEILRLARYFRN